MSKHRDIDGAHLKFIADLKQKQERAEKLRTLFQKGKSLLTKDNKEMSKEGGKKPSAFVEQQRQKYTASYPVSPTPTPPNAYTAQKRKESMDHQWIHHRSFERSIIER